MNLMADLHWLAGRWAEAQARRGMASPLKVLGYRTVRDSKLFDRLADGKTITVLNFEKVIGYLAAPGNWPAELLEEEVAERLALLGCQGVGCRVYVEREIVERKLVVRA